MAMTKKAKALATAVNRDKLYSIDEAIGLVKSLATAKFDETIEVSLNLGVDPRHADQMVRGVVTLPKGTGKTVRVGVFARGAKADEAKAAGADVVGAEDLLELVTGGTIDFDRCIATPDMMGLVGRLGKVLGPKGLMPNPKLGTVTMNVAEAVKAAKGGQVVIDQYAGRLVPNGWDRPVFSTFACCGGCGCCATALGHFPVLPFAKAGAFSTRRASPVASLTKLVLPYSHQQMLIILDEASVDQARLGAIRRRCL